MRMRDLAESVIVSKSRLSHQVARLEADGLVRREACSEDRRGSWAVLGDRGHDVLLAAAPHHVRLVRASIFDRLTRDEAAEFGRLLALIEG
jgi:DNA-binding MarR family transcriptional regulator